MLKLYNPTIHKNDADEQNCILSFSYALSSSALKVVRTRLIQIDSSLYTDTAYVCQQNVSITRNVFCGTWYLPHSHVHNERTVPIIVAGCNAHARNGRISTSGEKSDVTIVFLDPDFLYDAKISAIRVHLRQIYDYLIFARVFRTSWPKMFIFLGRDKIGEGWCDIDPNELVLPFGGTYVCANFGENRPRNATVSARRRTDTQTDRRKPSIAIWDR